MALRNTLLCTGLLGLLGAQEVQAQDTGNAYDSLTHGETLQLLAKKSEKINYQQFNEKVSNYSGAVIMLATNTCPSKEGEPVNRNMELVYIGLVDKFANSKVKDLPIKFTWFDTCGRSMADLLGIPGLETHMYLNGKQIDVMKDGPISERGVQAFNTNMTLWIEYTLLGIKQPEDKDKDVVALYKGTSNLEAYPRSEIQK